MGMLYQDQYQVSPLHASRTLRVLSSSCMLDANSTSLLPLHKSATSGHLSILEQVDLLRPPHCLYLTLPLFPPPFKAPYVPVHAYHRRPVEREIRLT